MRHIAWFNEAAIEPSPQGDLISGDPAVFHRCILPAREIEKLGIGCSVFGSLKEADPLDVSNHLQKLSSDIVVIGKMTCSNLLKLARAAKHLGCYVVADFDQSRVLTPNCIKLCELSDQIIAATPEIAAVLSEQTKMPVLVIPDGDEKPGSPNSINVTALRWLDVFKHLEAKPPLCANSNIPN